MWNVSENNLPFKITEYMNATMHPLYLSNVRAWHGHVPFAFFSSSSQNSSSN
jgi:hypothetical protein